MNRRTIARTLSLIVFGWSFWSGPAVGSVAAAAPADVPRAGADYLIFDADSVEFRIDPVGHRIVSLDDAGHREMDFGTLGTDNGELNYPIAAVFGPDDHLYVIERGNARVQKFDRRGRFVAEFGTGTLSHPSDIAIDRFGRIYVADTFNHCVQVFDRGGEPVGTIGALGDGAGALNAPASLTVTPSGQLHVVDRGNARVQAFTLDGRYLYGYGTYGSNEGELLSPGSIVANRQGQCLVADACSGFVHVFATGGAFVRRFRPTDDAGQPVVPVRLEMAPNDELYVWTGGHEAAPGAAAETPAPSELPDFVYVEMATSKGDILLELDMVRAPISVRNFVDYVESGFYDGTIFHRVMSNFMIQGGGFDAKMVQKPTRDPIRNEWQNGLKNVRGAIAMARTNAPDSATAQFFINVVDNGSLDRPRGGAAYAVFGRVIKGMDVVDAIREVKVATAGRYQNVPVEPVVIEKAVVVGRP